MPARRPRACEPRPLLLALSLLSAACGPAVPPPADAGPTGPAYAIDAGFLFGAATSAYQVEGHAFGADWWQWEQVPLGSGTCDTILDCASSDAGPDHYDQYASDLAQAAALSMNAYRFSIEWSRVEPSPGVYDPVQIAHYHDVLAACAANGLTPMVTLDAVTLPQWLHGVKAGRTGASDADWTGGWRGLPGETPGPAASIVQAFAQFAGDMAAEYGAQVDLWVTLEDPVTLAAQAYVTGFWPPGAVLHLTDFRDAIVNLAYAHAAAYDAIHAADLTAAAPGGPPAQVSVEQQLSVFLLDPSYTGTDGALLTAQMDYVFNWLFLNAVIDGNLDTHFDLSYSHPGDPEGEGTGLAALGGRADFLALGYYSTEVVTPYLGGLADAQGSSLYLPATFAENSDPSVPHGDSPPGAQIDPAGLHDELLAAAGNWPYLPIYVVENGVADAADQLRAAFIVDHVAQLQRAMADGADVRGYFHWALLDDFEWQYGLTPRYGLLSVDEADPARPRTVTKGAQAYQQIIQAGGVTPAIQAQWAPDAG
ncbi:MAG TPA: family 1 glycosylhydrolase [Myxococcales bacterium]|nr:family 1 glycosylhydrolase [Myxococcales bacterium]